MGFSCGALRLASQLYCFYSVQMPPLLTQEAGLCPALTKYWAPQLTLTAFSSLLLAFLVVSTVFILNSWFRDQLAAVRKKQLFQFCVTSTCITKLMGQIFFGREKATIWFSAPASWNCIYSDSWQHLGMFEFQHIYGSEWMWLLFLLLLCLVIM